MACPTCDGTMHNINYVAVYRIFLCPRCGTVKTETYTGDPKNWRVEVHTPKLVERCRALLDLTYRVALSPDGPEKEAAADRVIGAMQSVAEASRPPRDRPADLMEAPR